MKKSNIFNKNIYILVINKINIVTQKLFKLQKDDKEERMVDPVKDSAVNNLLLLYLIDETNSKGFLDEHLKLQKLVFLIQKNLNQKKLKGFSYNFFRWEKGPFSAGVANDLKLLSKNGFVKWDDKKIYLTKEGKRVLVDCKEIFEQNSIFNKTIDDITDKYSNVPANDLKNLVYQLNMFVPIIRKVMPIEKIPKRRLILFKPQESKMKQFFEMDEDWEATLELLFNRGGLVSLEKAYEDAKEGRHGEPIRVHTS